MNLSIKDLWVKSEDDKEILKGLSIDFELGKVYALVGPNGHGKSTLLSTIMGDPNYVVSNGTITLDNEDITNMEVDERARKGIYLAMQYPVEIAGVSNIELIKSAMEKLTGKTQSILSLYPSVNELATKLRIDHALIDREVNVGFSGGEKKKNELLQLLTYKPKFALIDEIDSGLDIDSIQALGDIINQTKDENHSYIIISHYKDLYEKIKPDYGIVIKDGKVKEVVNYEKLMDILTRGFDYA